MWLAPPGAVRPRWASITDARPPRLTNDRQRQGECACGEDKGEWFARERLRTVPEAVLEDPGRHGYHVRRDPKLPPLAQLVLVADAPPADGVEGRTRGDAFNSDGAEESAAFASSRARADAVMRVLSPDDGLLKLLPLLV